MTLRVIVDPEAERGAVRVNPVDFELMQRSALVFNSSDPSKIDEAAKIIDRLLVLLRPMPIINRRDTYNAEDNALAWLKKHDHPSLWLSDATRREMEKLK